MAYIRPSKPLALLFLAISPFAVAAEGADQSAALLPDGMGLTSIQTNPYMGVGMDAATRGMRTLSIQLDAQPAQTLQQRINLAHLGLGVSGWTFVTATVLDRNGTADKVLLTYRQSRP